MAIEVIDKIKQKGNNNFPLMDASDVEMKNGMRVEDAITRLTNPTENELPADNICKANIMYFLGEIAELAVGFPNNAQPGDMIYLCFKSGDSATRVTLTTENHVGLNSFSAKTDCYCELIGLWNGAVWSFVINEVG